MLKTRGAGRALAVLVGLVVVGATVTATAGEVVESERAAIEAAVRDYIDGWYEGDAERMERALHPDLAKRVVRKLASGGEFLNTVSASNMVAYTAASFGKGKLPEGYVNQVKILEATERIAMVRTESPDFVDYIHVAKIAGTWKIVNVLWEPVEKNE